MSEWPFLLHLETRAMADKAPVVPKVDAEVTPAPVEVVASIPISVQIAPESLASLGAPPAGTAEPVTVATATPLGTPSHATTTTTTTTAPPPLTVTKGEGVTLSPTTTEAEDDTAEGQRSINFIWERTQSYIALMVVVAGVVVNSAIITAIIFFNKEASVTQLALISISLQFINLTTGIVIGFYFSRTNHSARGGVGPKPEFPYTGR